MAMNHGKAKKVYKYVLVENAEEEGKNVCPCCSTPIDGEKIPVSAPLSEIYHLGPGYPMYFLFIKSCIMMFSLIMILSGFFNFVTNIIADDCPGIYHDSTTAATEEPFCENTFNSILTLAHKRDHKEYMEA